MADQETSLQRALREAAERLDALPDGGSEADLDREVAALLRQAWPPVGTFPTGAAADLRQAARDRRGSRL